MTKNSCDKDQQGFTLIEVIVATVIAGLLIVLIMTFMIDTVAKNATETARSDMLREAQLTLDNIGREIRLSSTADEQNRWQDDNAPSAPSNKLSWESNSDTLILATAAMDSSHNILFADPLHYVSNKNNNIYFVQDHTLYKRVLADPVSDNAAETTCPPDPSDSCPDDRILVRNVKSFAVKYFDNEDQEVTPSSARSVELTLSLEQIKYHQTITADFTTRTVFRNE